MLPQIRLQSSMIKIDILHVKSQQKIEQPMAEMIIEQPRADMDIKTIPGRLTIDQTQAWEERNLKHIFRLNEENALNSHQDSMEGIGRRSLEGDQLMMIENGGNAIASIAEHSISAYQKESNISWIPSPFSVRFHYTPAVVNLDIKANKPNIQVQINKPSVDYLPGRIEASVSRYQDLQIDFVNVNPLGLSYEQKI